MFHCDCNVIGKRLDRNEGFKTIACGVDKV